MIMLYNIYILYILPRKYMSPIQKLEWYFSFQDNFWVLIKNINNIICKGSKNKFKTMVRKYHSNIIRVMDVYIILATTNL